MRNLLILPILIPLAAMIISLFFWGRVRIHRWLAVIGCGGGLIVSIILLNCVINHGIQVLCVGNWQAPFGITLVADRLSAVMVLLSSIIGFAVAIYSLASVDHKREVFGYYPLLQILLMGVNGAFLTGDLFNLYVWFEVMLIASFVLLALGGERSQLEGSIKYVTLNLLSSGLFLAGVGCVYGLTGTLNMADISQHFNQSSGSPIVTAVAMLFFVSFGIKAAVFPLYFWLPASYHTPPVAVSAVFAGLLTKVGVYAMIRVFTLLFVKDVQFTHNLILWAAVLTMITGVLGAAAQKEFRRTLSFHIISQIGYMIFGLGMYTPLALAGSVFYIIHHIIVKTNLFLISGIVYQAKGSYEYNRLGGAYDALPWTSLFFLISALSLAGIPPLSGFWGKFILLKSGVEEGLYAMAAVALAVGLLTLYSMVKIWGEVFWKKAPIVYSDKTPALTTKNTLLLCVPVAALALCTVWIGLFAEPVFLFAMDTAHELLHSDRYIMAVLGSIKEGV